MTSTESHQSLLDFALKLAKRAETEIMPRFRSCSVDYKPDGSEVTEADREAEKVLREEIEKTYPEHAILGEEFGEKETDSEFQWVLDPVDGTTPFSVGMPTFGTLVSLLKNNQPIVGVVHMPAMNETVFAAQDLGCWQKIGDRDPKKISVETKVTTIKDAYISASGVHSSDINHEKDQVPYKLTNLINSAKRFRFFGDCTQHSMVCSGKINTAIDTIMQPWDIAAIVPCVREAGGVVSSLSGEEENVVFSGSLLSTSHRELHGEIVEILKP